MENWFNVKSDCDPLLPLYIIKIKRQKMYRPTYVGGLVFIEDCMRALSMALTLFLQVEK